MDDTCTALKSVIDHIWDRFDSCCAIFISERYYDGNDMQCDNYWKQQQAFNALLLLNCISKTPNLDKQVKTKAEEWTMQMVPMMLFDSDIENTTGKNGLISRLSEFSRSVDPIIDGSMRPVVPTRLDREINDVIDLIWDYFGDCAFKEDRRRVRYVKCSIADHKAFIRAMRKNIETLESSFHASVVTNKNVLEKKHTWISVTIPSFVNAIQNYSDANKQSLLVALLEFRSDLARAMISNTGSDMSQPSYSELHAAVDLLCNLYDRIYPTT